MFELEISIRKKELSNIYTNNSAIAYKNVELIGTIAQLCEFNYSIFVIIKAKLFYFLSYLRRKLSLF